jgi:transcriptional regulator
MYARDASREKRTEVLHRAIRDIRFGTLVIADDRGAPQATHLPVVLKTEGAAALELHVARANPIWKLLQESMRPALAIFQGPQAYVRPGWYPAKREHGKVVPTWAYVSVHARGRAALMPTEALLAHIREVSDLLEAGQPQPWSVDDAPEGYITALARGIVGIRIPLDSLEGVWKLNQHRSEDDRKGMIAGLEARGEADSRGLARLMREIEAHRQQEQAQQ